jgi:hypothetical protein
MPCQSTGVYFAAPTRPVLAFFTDLVADLDVNVFRWEQEAFNTVTLGPEHFGGYGLGFEP